MSTRSPDAEALLTPAEVATMFRVDPKTVTRWAKSGKLKDAQKGLGTVGKDDKPAAGKKFNEVKTAVEAALFFCRRERFRFRFFPSGFLSRQNAVDYQQRSGRRCQLAG